MNDVLPLSPCVQLTLSGTGVIYNMHCYNQKASHDYPAASIQF